MDRNEFRLSWVDVKDVYYNSPIHFLPNVTDPVILDWYHKSTIIICTGQGAWENEAIEDTKALDNTFREKGIPVRIDYWGYDVNHDWPWWYIQMNYFLSKLY